MPYGCYVRCVFDEDHGKLNTLYCLPELHESQFIVNSSSCTTKLYPVSLRLETNL